VTFKSVMYSLWSAVMFIIIMCSQWVLSCTRCGCVVPGVIFASISVYLQLTKRGHL
jgi:hypothetical protein